MLWLLKILVLVSVAIVVSVPQVQVLPDSVAILLQITYWFAALVFT